MILRALHGLANHLERSGTQARPGSFTIRGDDSDPYLTRYRIAGRLIGEPETAAGRSWYLHRIHRGDEDRCLHNHPMASACSFVLTGGYTEERRDIKTGEVRLHRVRPGTINPLGPRQFHRIVELHGPEVWTLFRAGEKVSSWGFLVDGRYVDSKVFEARKRGLPDPVLNYPLPSWLKVCYCCGHLYPPPIRRIHFTRGGKWQCAALSVCDYCLERNTRAVTEALTLEPSERVSLITGEDGKVMTWVPGRMP